MVNVWSAPHLARPPTFFNWQIHTRLPVRRARHFQIGVAHWIDDDGGHVTPPRELGAVGGFPLAATTASTILRTPEDSMEQC